jgi:hypothetical protein
VEFPEISAATDDETKEKLNEHARHIRFNVPRARADQLQHSRAD